MNEGIKKVFETLKNDRTLAEKMRKCTVPQEAYELARTVADGFTLEEFQDEMKKAYEAASGVRGGELSEADLEKIQNTESELSELDLENVSGGGPGGIYGDGEPESEWGFSGGF
ncbi:MAG: hypothetical protein LUD16_10525 [Lachnospiraceae bacterium]|nr:hypothetical protein [Lachnospiraceae bacterium]